MNLSKKLKTIGLVSVAALALSACGSIDRLAHVGRAPGMSPVSDKQVKRAQQPIELPMPEVRDYPRIQNSLWHPDRTTFFEDQRAAKVGDILTVVIEIDEEAELANETSRSRSSTEDAQAPALLGYEAYLDDILPDNVDPSDLIQFGNTSSYAGTGDIEREEEITVRVAALVTQELPNGNFIIHGRQELLVNYEKRIVQIDGVIRPEDISVTNTINYDQIAQARIVYGGEGQISDVQQPRYGQQIYDIVFPF